MDRNSNAYTFIFSIVLIAVVATLLALASQGLKPLQKANMRREKMQNILASVGKDYGAMEVEEHFNQEIVKQFVLDGNGKVVLEDDSSAFQIDVLKDYKSGLKNIYKEKATDTSEMRSELIKADARYPLFLHKDKQGKESLIVPVVGTGLWGPIWGFLAIDKSDGKTIVGTFFDHKTETPGLGAEIKEKSFQKQWEDKKIYDNSGNFKPIKVVKGGADPNNKHGVDAISGGTITSNGVTEMVQRTLLIYKPYFDQIR